MKIKSGLTAACLLVTGSLSSALAQEVTIEWSGEVGESIGDTFIPMGTLFTASATVDSSIPPYETGYNEYTGDYADFEGHLIDFRFTLEAPNGEPIELTVPTQYEILATDNYFTTISDYSHDATGGSTIRSNSYFLNSSDFDEVYFYLASSGSPEFLTGVDGFPSFNNFMVAPEQARFNQIFIIYEGGYENFFINVTSFGTAIIDEDGDGVADEADLCPVSITDETVSFGDGSVVADVENVYDANGCSIMDRYAACEATEEEQPVRGIRSTRSGPSSCEKAVSYDLVADGVISYAEARLLRNALYEAN